MKHQKTIILTLLIILAVSTSALGQSTNEIIGVSPFSASVGMSNVVVTFTLDSDTPPPPPAGIMPSSVTIGTISGMAITHPSQHTVTATFDIPASEPAGYKDCEVTFSTPNGDVVFAAYSGFEVLSNADSPPTISRYPQSSKTPTGSPVTFEVTASGSGTLSYQWQKDLADIVGATDTSFTISNVTQSDIGDYRCIVTNEYGSSATNSATLTLTTLTVGKYPIVDTNQTACYDDWDEITAPANGEAFYGQDAQYDGNQPSYTLSPDGLTVTDNVTGLVWQKTPDTDGDGTIDASDKFTISEAEARPAALNAADFAGYDDWRLPTIKELYSLIIFSGTDPSGYTGTDPSGLIPFMDDDYFDVGFGDTDAGERLIDGQYASSTHYITDNDKIFGVNFVDGRIKGYDRNAGTSEKEFYVICVRGNPDYGTNYFIDNGDGTVTDLATGLMWQKADSSTAYDWENALTYAENLNLAGHTDWRLPNAKELQSLVDYSRSPDVTNSAAINPVFDVTAFSGESGSTEYPWYWSSTTHANWTGTATYACYVAFGRAWGYMNNSWVDIHGAGCQRSDPKSGNLSNYSYVPDGYYHSQAPQGDAIRIYNYVKCVRDAAPATAYTISDAKQTADFEYLQTSGQVVTAVFDGVFYAEDADRAAGIRVESDSEVSIGDTVYIEGISATTQSGEKCITNASVSTTGSGVVTSLGLTGNALGGGSLDYDSETGMGQKAAPFYKWEDTGTLALTSYDMTGVNNIGMLVSVWGEVTWQDPSGTGFYIDDGSVNDDWDGTGEPAELFITCDSSICVPSVGDYVSVTGAASLYTHSDGSPRRTVIARSQSDIVAQ